MQIRDCMTREVRVVGTDTTLAQAARAMAEIDAGILPVADSDRLIGMVSDRDIAIRGVGHGLGPDTRIGEVMSEEVLYCSEDDDVEDVLNNMAEIQVRRLPVMSREKRLVGIVSLSDLRGDGGAAHMGDVLCEVARPSTHHSQM